MNFLFWNMHRNIDAFPHLVNITNEESIDVLALAEFPDDMGAKDDLLDRLSGYKYLVPVVPGIEKVRIFYRCPRVEIINKYDGAKVFVKTVKSSGTEISLIFCHLGSKINNDEHQQHFMAQHFVEEVERYEDLYGNENTLICGDFNMNPFELGMVDCTAFHAVMDRNIAKKLSRTVDGKEYKYFYNPMWGCLGDNGKGDFPGTHYYSPSRPMQFFWNMYDQVLIRPELIDFFVDSDLKIVTQGRYYSLLDAKGMIDTSISDHLPIMFNLNI